MNQKPLNEMMDNVLAKMLSDICLEVANQKDGVGDFIDRGLILRRRLEEEGFALTVIPGTKAARYVRK
ncbi:MAG: hypothetical protein HQL35_04860 [Alphaproteobacteria bacterium]|nr:hypothetical protein [Alphaproteobacteria bacterium]